MMRAIIFVSISLSLMCAGCIANASEASDDMMGQIP